MKSKNKKSVNTIDEKKDPAILKQMDKLKKQIEDANSNIKQTEKLLDVDIFLKQQKKKRLEYAKNLNSDFEEQKKLRQAKLYKKHNREKKQEENKNNEKIEFKIQNFRALMPLDIVKVLSNERREKKFIKQGHHYRLSDLNVQDYEGIHEEESIMFENLKHNKQTDKMKYDGDSESKHIVWKNVKQIVENCLQMKNLPIIVNEGELLPTMEYQNLMNSLVMINEEISQRLFRQNESIVMGELNMSGKLMTIWTDKNVLVREFTHKYVNISSRSVDPNVVWPTIIQKIYKKMKILDKSLAIETSLFTTLHQIYGIDAQFIPLTNKNMILQNIPNVFGHLLQQGRIGLLNINHNNNIYKNRIYLLESVREQVDQIGQKQIMYKIKNPWRGNLIQGKNLNIFNILQLLQLFNVVVILRDYPSRWKCHRINVSYFSNGSISMSNNEWTKNPQYLFTITKTSSIRIVLRKQGADLEEQKSDENYIYGFLLFHNKESDNKISCMKMEYLIKKTKSNDLNMASYVGQLTKGNYIVIPYSTKKSQKCYQFYILDFFIEKQDNIHFGKARLFDYNYKSKGSRLNNDEKVMQSLQSAEKFEKPKIQVMEIPKLFKSKLKKSVIEGLQLNYYKNCRPNHFFVPGFIHNLLINKEIDVDIKLDKTKDTNDIKNEELTKEEQAQNLSILLGYDVIDDDINQGKMRQHIQATSDCFDFRDFGLGEEGLSPILQCLSQYPQIVELDLRGNNLTDTGITFVCYYLEKSDRMEIRKLNVCRNEFGKIGKKALEGLKSRFPKLVIEGPGFIFE